MEKSETQNNKQTYYISIIYYSFYAIVLFLFARRILLDRFPVVILNRYPFLDFKIPSVLKPFILYIFIFFIAFWRDTTRFLKDSIIAFGLGLLAAILGIFSGLFLIPFVLEFLAFIPGIGTVLLFILAKFTLLFWDTNKFPPITTLIILGFGIIFERYLTRKRPINTQIKIIGLYVLWTFLFHYFLFFNFLRDFLSGVHF